MLENFKSVYIIGIGGISMSSLAYFLHARGIKILGSDISFNSEIEKLVKDNIIDYKQGYAPEFVKICDAVIYTAAVSQDNSDILLAYKLGKSILSRAEVLGELSKNKKTISIAGTHGKTTTTGLISAMLLANGLNPNIHIGGILKNINSNVNVSESDILVTEACEYKDSFLSLKNYISIVLNIKPDHLDYFKNINNEFISFQKFVENTDDNGFVIINNDDELSRLLKTHCKKITFAINNYADLQAKDIKIDNKAHISFNLHLKGENLGNVELPCYGYHNIYNVLACAAVAVALSIPFDKLKCGIKSFKGIARRFEIISKEKNTLIVHDYAHHPDEIKATLSLCRSLGYKKLVAIFQPHTFSRTRDLYNQFLNCFDQADEVCFLPIYPAREKPIKGITSYKLSKDINNKINDLKDKNCKLKKAKYLNNFVKCKDYIEKYCENDVLFAILGAGDIVELAYNLKK